MREVNERTKYTTRVWKPFDCRTYRGAIRTGFLWGVIREFCRDIRRCHERIWRGYCDYDLYSIDNWFLGLMPTMLQQFKDSKHGCPVEPDYISHKVFLDGEKEDDESLKAWDDILDSMIFLLREADAETCTRENPCQAEFDRAEKAFQERYGFWGEKMEPDYEEGSIGSRIHFMNELEENKKISEQFWEEERKIELYRHECKDMALDLFKKWFYDLWD